MSNSGLEEEQTLVVSESGYSVSEWSDMSTSELEEEQTLFDSETTRICSSSSPMVDMSLHWDTLS
jgi:hypothetical protein